MSAKNRTQKTCAIVIQILKQEVFNMNLKELNDAVLLAHAGKLVAQEREILTQFLHHLREINDRRLYSSMGYKSLFDFLLKYFKYSEDQAYRRLAAMKILKELPQVEVKIAEGELSLSHLSLAHSLFNQEKKLDNEFSVDQKLSVFEEIANKSTREAEKITHALSSAPETLKPDRMTTASESRIEIKFISSVNVQKKVEKLKGLLAHQNPHISLGELFEKLCDLGLQEWDKSKTKLEKKKAKSEITNGDLACSKSTKQELAIREMMESKATVTDLMNQNRSNASTLNFKKVGAPRKSCVNNSHAQIKREVFRKANNQCENCGSHFALEIDHIRPRAMGGETSLDNLRLLCRSCNQRAAIKVFSQSKMSQYLS